MISATHLRSLVAQILLSVLFPFDCKLSTANFLSPRPCYHLPAARNLRLLFTPSDLGEGRALPDRRSS